jgi:hypothetical protein
MSEHAHPGAGAAGGVRPTPPSTPEPRTETRPPAERKPALSGAWAGWITFAGAMMILVGLFNVIEGLVALLRPRYYVVGPEGLLVFSLAGWGLVHLIIGVLAVLAGMALFTGAMWARVTGVVLAVINAIFQLAFLPAYPVWATIVIALDVIIIWAIIAHGGEAARWWKAPEPR